MNRLYQTSLLNPHYGLAAYSCGGNDGTFPEARAAYRGLSSDTLSARDRRHNGLFKLDGRYIGSHQCRREARCGAPNTESVTRRSCAKIVRALRCNASSAGRPMVNVHDVNLEFQYVGDHAAVTLISQSSDNLRGFTNLVPRRHL